MEQKIIVRHGSLALYTHLFIFLYMICSSQLTLSKGGQRYDCWQTHYSDRAYCIYCQVTHLNSTHPELLDANPSGSLILCICILSKPLEKILNDAVFSPNKTETC